MIKKISILFLSAIVFSCSVQDEKKAQPIQIIPKPAKAEISNGTFTVSSKTKVLFENENPEVKRIANGFVNRLNEIGSLNLESETLPVNDTKNSISFNLVSDEEKFGNEGYDLQITKQGINIIANKPAGLFYATQSIYQLVSNEYLFDNERGNINFPCVKIFDKPRFAWRGELIDPARHFLSLEIIKRNIEHLARFKINVLHLHLTDDQGWRIDIKSLPNLTNKGAWRADRGDIPWWGRLPQQPGEKVNNGGFYTQEEIKDLIDYAAKRYITIIPEIDFPGHSQSAIASYPEFSCDGREYFVATGGVSKDNTLCPGKEETFEFTEKILNEIMDLFPSEYIHIGGDECNKGAWKQCPDCQKRIKDESLKNEHELQSYFITRVEQIINKRGKKMIGWDEILEGGLAPNATVMSWRGEAGGIKSVEMGHDVVMSPNNFCYLDRKQGNIDLEPDLGYSKLLLSTVYSYNPIPESFTTEQSKHILGVQGNLWGESIKTENDANYMLFPRLLALAEVGWTAYEQKNFDDFILRMENTLERFDNEEINYAKSAYRVLIKTTLDSLNESVVMSMETELKDLDIRYTIDGAEPASESTLYSEPFKVINTTTFKARAFRKVEAKGQTSIKTVTIHEAAQKSVTTNDASKNQKSDASILTDCLNGGLDNQSSYWFRTDNNALEVVVDSLEKMTCRFVKLKANKVNKTPDWHRTPGTKTWLAIDEIVVK